MSSYIYVYLYFTLLPATIKASDQTKTTNVGDSVTLNVTTNLADDVLRWNHNGSPVPEWNSLKTVTIANVKLSDKGIYECYENGIREEGLHAIMRLIVRGTYRYFCVVRVESLFVRTVRDCHV